MSSKPRISVAERRRLKKQQQQQLSSSVAKVVEVNNNNNNNTINNNTKLKSTIVLILCGISGSGKSTFVEQFQQSHETSTICVISRDTLRKDMFGFNEETLYLYESQDKATKSYKESLINKVEDEMVESHVNRVDYIIFDNTNLRLDYINKYRNQFYRPTTIHIVMFSCTTEEAIKRQGTRVRKVPEGVIMYQHNTFQELRRNRELLPYFCHPEELVN